jgi:peptidoglycan/xylan/chitin deacetylase (PgdA/CDA1 family)
MYHYVRNLDKSRYPGINALGKSEFNYQLDYLQEEYNIVSIEDCRKAIYDEQSLPSNPALLTFDDGFSDHYATVFPELKARGISAAFFPPAEPIINDTVLNVHKIHFVLANCDDINSLLDAIYEAINRHRNEFNLEYPEKYYDRLAEPGRWDPEEVVFVKRLLQRELSYDARSTILDNMFEQFVDVEEKVLSQELYMTIPQLQVMINSGMEVGSHTYSHRWLETLSRRKQREEVTRSVAFLEAIGADITDWTMCYPYGSYDEKTLDILSDTNCDLALTTDNGVAHLHKGNAFTLERLDTNDLPQSPDDH